MRYKISLNKTISSCKARNPRKVDAVVSLAAVGYNNNNWSVRMYLNTAIEPTSEKTRWWIFIPK